MDGASTVFWVLSYHMFLETFRVVDDLQLQVLVSRGYLCTRFLLKAPVSAPKFWAETSQPQGLAFDQLYHLMPCVFLVEAYSGSPIITD
jgi:hypothetical protein